MLDFIIDSALWTGLAPWLQSTIIVFVQVVLVMLAVVIAVAMLTLAEPSELGVPTISG